MIGFAEGRARRRDTAPEVPRRPMKALSKLGSLLRSKAPKSPKAEAYTALIVRSTAQCCDAALDTLDHPIFKKNRPALPLPGCTMPLLCVCRFRERPDRRIGERRFASAVETEVDTAKAPRRSRERRNS